MKTIRGRIGDVDIEVDSYSKKLVEKKREDLKPEEVVRYDVVTFKKEGKEPVFLAIERENNRCNSENLKKRLYMQAVLEQQPHRHATNQFIRAEEMQWFEMKRDGTLNKADFAMPPMKEGNKMKLNGLETATVKQIDEAIKKKLGTEQNIASEFFARNKKLDNQETLDRAQIKKTPEIANRQRLQEKVDQLNDKEEDLVAKAMKRKLKF